GFLQRHPPLDHVDDVDAGKQFIDEAVGNQAAHKRPSLVGCRRRSADPPCVGATSVAMLLLWSPGTRASRLKSLPHKGGWRGQRLWNTPMTASIASRNRITKQANRILAIVAVAPETPPKPSQPVISDTMAKMMAHFSMRFSRP